MSLRETFIANIYYDILRKILISKMEKKKISPNKVTVVGGIIASLVPVGFYFYPLIGTIILLFSAIADSLDGQLAKKTFTPTKFGAFLDSTIDRISDFFYLLGFWIPTWSSDSILFSTALFFVALLLTLLFSYEKARIEGLGGECKVGFMERAKRVIFLLILGVIFSIYPTPNLIVWGMIIYNILMLYSVAQRIRCAKTVL